MTEAHSKTISIHDLGLSYGKTVALENVSGVLQPNSLTAVFGPNGGGKSTFVKMLANLLKPSSGSIEHQCRSTCHPAYLPQVASINKHFPLTVREVVAMGLWSEVGAFRKINARHQEKIEGALERVGLKSYAHRLIETLSGGQFQRMLFARIILEDASLIILDEPFTAIDLHTSKTLLELIQEWHRAGKTILVVLHDLDMARTYFPQSMLLARTCLGWGDTKDVLIDESIMDAYQKIMRETDV